MSRLIPLAMLLMIGVTSLAFAQVTASYGQTRRLLLAVETVPANDAFKQLFRETDGRKRDLINALDDADGRVVLNAQLVLLYSGDPDLIREVKVWSSRRNELQWPNVGLLVSPHVLRGRSASMTGLVCEQLFAGECGKARVLARNRATDTYLVEVVNGSDFSEGWHVVVRRADGNWLVLSKTLAWQS